MQTGLQASEEVERHLALHPRPQLLARELAPEAGLPPRLQPFLDVLDHVRRRRAPEPRQHRLRHRVPVPDRPRRLGVGECRMIAAVTEVQIRPDPRPVRTRPVDHDRVSPGVADDALEASTILPGPAHRPVEPPRGRAADLSPFVEPARYRGAIASFSAARRSCCPTVAPTESAAPLRAEAVSRLYCNRPTGARPERRRPTGAEVKRRGRFIDGGQIRPAVPAIPALHRRPDEGGGGAVPDRQGKSRCWSQGTDNIRAEIHCKGLRGAGWSSSTPNRRARLAPGTAHEDLVAPRESSKSPMSSSTTGVRLVRCGLRSSGAPRAREPRGCARRSRSRRASTSCCTDVLMGGRRSSGTLGINGAALAVTSPTPPASPAPASRRCGSSGCPRRSPIPGPTVRNPRTEDPEAIRTVNRGTARLRRVSPAGRPHRGGFRTQERRDRHVGEAAAGSGSA